MKISVAMCTYNGARFLGPQLDSLVSQARQPDEVVICDDQSEDESTEIVRSWARRTPFPVDLRVNERRLGVVGNFNKAISLCTGDLISLADQDDVWFGYKLSKTEQAFEEEPKLGVWFTDGRLVDEEQRPLPLMLWQAFGLDKRWQEHVTGPLRLSRLLRRSVVTGATMTFAARYKSLVLPAPEDSPGYLHDRWIATLIAAVAPIACSPEPSILYRLHSGQVRGVAKVRGPLEALKARMPRRHDLIEDDLRAAYALAVRLCGRAPDQITPEARTILAERIRLLEMRAKLPSARLSRVVPVMRSLVCGDYGRQAEGLASAAKDLLL